MTAPRTRFPIRRDIRCVIDHRLLKSYGLEAGPAASARFCKWRSDVEWLGD